MTPQKPSNYFIRQKRAHLTYKSFQNNIDKRISQGSKSEDFNYFCIQHFGKFLKQGIFPVNIKIKHMRQIRICLGSSCYSRGNKNHLEIIKKYIAENHLEAKISFCGHLCEEKCSNGPILKIDDKTYQEVNLSGLYKILQEEFPCN